MSLFSPCTFAAKEVPIGTSLEAEELLWTTGGSINWYGFSWDAAWMADDDFARIDVSGTTRKSSVSKISTTITGPAIVSFMWQSTCRSFAERLFARVDGIEQVICPNSSTWQSGKIFIPFGSHTVDWLFIISETVAAPDFGSSAALNAIRIDEFLDSEIAVYQPADNELVDADSVSFGKIGINTKKFKTFIIKNNGAKAISNIAGKIKGSSAFKITTVPAANLAPGAQTKLVVRFRPTFPENMNAKLRITSSDPDENVISVNLTGIGRKKASLPPILSWTSYASKH